MLRTVGLLLLGGVLGILATTALATLVAIDPASPGRFRWWSRLLVLASAAVAVAYPCVRLAMCWRARRFAAASRPRFAGALLAGWTAAATVAVFLPLIEAIGLSYINTVKTMDLNVMAQTVQAYAARAGAPPREWRDVGEFARTARQRGESLEGFAADPELLDHGRSGDRVYTYVRQTDGRWRIETSHRDLCGRSGVLVRTAEALPPARCGLRDFYPYFYRRALTGAS